MRGGKPVSNPRIPELACDTESRPFERGPEHGRKQAAPSAPALDNERQQQGEQPGKEADDDRSRNQ